jgi:hypothetical protein
MNKSFLAVAIIALAALLYFGLPLLTTTDSLSDKSQSEEEGQVYFQYSKLPKGLYAQMGDYTVHQGEIDSLAPMRSFRGKKRDLLFLLVYKQYVSFSETPIPVIQFSFKKPSRSASSLLNQYGIPQKFATRVEFSAFDPEQGLARIGGRVIQEKDLDKNNFIWGSFETEIFRFKLAAIDKSLKNKIIKAEAEKLNMPVNDYKIKYIYDKIPMEISERDQLAYMKKFNMDDTPRNRASAYNRLVELRKKRAEDYILEKYIMDLPVKLSLRPPQYDLDVKSEWTPAYREGGKSFVTLNLFSDTQSKASRVLISGLRKILEKYEDVQLFYRPVFFATDKIQKAISEMQFCVWMEAPKSFWNFLEKTSGDQGPQIEQRLYGVVHEEGLSQEKMRDCFINHKYQEVVDYHTQYANYLGIFAGPVLYINGEVMSGNIDPIEVEKIIQRQLELPTAAKW